MAIFSFTGQLLLSFRHRLRRRRRLRRRVEYSSPRTVFSKWDRLYSFTALLLSLLFSFFYYIRVRISAENTLSLSLSLSVPRHWQHTPNEYKDSVQGPLLSLALSPFL